MIMQRGRYLLPKVHLPLLEVSNRNISLQTKKQCFDLQGNIDRLKWRWILDSIIRDETETWEKESKGLTVNDKKAECLVVSKEAVQEASHEGGAIKLSNYEHLTLSDVL